MSGKEDAKCKIEPKSAGLSLWVSKSGEDGRNFPGHVSCPMTPPSLTSRNRPYHGMASLSNANQEIRVYNVIQLKMKKLSLQIVPENTSP